MASVKEGTTAYANGWRSEFNQEHARFYYWNIASPEATTCWKLPDEATAAASVEARSHSHMGQSTSTTQPSLISDEPPSHYYRDDLGSDSLQVWLQSSQIDDFHVNMEIDTEKPISELVRQAAELGRIPLQQLRLTITGAADGVTADAVTQLRSMCIRNQLPTQLWPSKHRSKEIFGSLPGIRNFLGPAITSSACALIGAGIPIRVVELVLTKIFSLGVDGAPVGTLVYPALRAEAGVCTGLSTLQVEAEYDTEDGLPLGPRVLVTVSAEEHEVLMPEGHAGNALEVTLEVPSCINLPHLKREIRAAIPTMQHSRRRLMWKHSQISMCPKQIYSELTLQELTDFKPDNTPCIHLEVYLEQPLQRSAGRPFMSAKTPIVASGNRVLADEWSALNVAQILNSQ